MGLHRTGIHLELQLPASLRDLGAACVAPVAVAIGLSPAVWEWSPASRTWQDSQANQVLPNRRPYPDAGPTSASISHGKRGVVSACRFHHVPVSIDTEGECYMGDGFRSCPVERERRMRFKVSASSWRCGKPIEHRLGILSKALIPKPRFTHCPSHQAATIKSFNTSSIRLSHRSYQRAVWSPKHVTLPSPDIWSANFAKCSIHNVHLD